MVCDSPPETAELLIRPWNTSCAVHTTAWGFYTGINLFNRGDTGAGKESVEPRERPLVKNEIYVTSKSSSGLLGGLSCHLNGS